MEGDPPSAPKKSSVGKKELIIRVIEAEEDGEGFVVEVTQRGSKRQMCLRAQDLKELQFHLRKTYPKKGLVPKGFKKMWKIRKKSEETKLKEAYNFMLSKVAKDADMRKDPVIRHIFQLDGFVSKKQKNNNNNNNHNTDNTDNTHNTDNNDNTDNTHNTLALAKVEDAMKESLSYMCTTLRQQSEGFSFSEAEHLLDAESAKHILKMQAFEHAFAYNSLIQQSNRVITLMREYLRDAEEMLSDISLAIEKRDSDLLTTRLVELSEEAEAAYKRAATLESEYESFLCDIDAKLADLKAKMKAAKDRKEAMSKSNVMMFISAVIPSLLLLPLTVPNGVSCFSPNQTRLRAIQVVRAVMSSAELLTQESLQGAGVCATPCLAPGEQEKEEKSASAEGLAIAEYKPQQQPQQPQQPQHRQHRSLSNSNGGITNLDIEAYTDPVQLLALPFVMCGVVEQTDDSDSLFESVYHLYKKADTRLKEQTLNWKKLVVALDGLRTQTSTINFQEDVHAWESLEELSEELSVAAKNYHELRQEVDNYINYLRDKGITPLLPERRI